VARFVASISHSGKASRRQTKVLRLTSNAMILGQFGIMLFREKAAPVGLQVTVLGGVVRQCSRSGLPQIMHPVLANGKTRTRAVSPCMRGQRPPRSARLMSARA